MLLHKEFFDVLTVLDFCVQADFSDIMPVRRRPPLNFIPPDDDEEVPYGARPKAGATGPQVRSCITPVTPVSQTFLASEMDVRLVQRIVLSGINRVWMVQVEKADPKYCTAGWGREQLAGGKEAGAHGPS